MQAMTSFEKEVSIDAILFENETESILTKATTRKSK